MTALVLQCGGPTAVINASLAAVARRWRELSPGSQLLGGRHGLRALLTGDWFELDCHDDSWLHRLESSSGMALGGGRDRLDATGQAQATERLRRDGIDALLLIGGNGTMAAGRELHRHPRAPRVIGVPKTVDNDIPATDLCPGYLSAARFVRDAVSDVSDDVQSMRGYEEVVLIEVMGRHAGWLAMAALLARRRPDDAPHVVLTPETPLDEEAALAEIEKRTREHGVCVVVVSEGARDRSGTLLTLKGRDATVERDSSGQVILGRSGGPLPYLAAIVRKRLGRSCRQVRPDVLQRCSRAHVSALDKRLAALAGAAAVDLAVAGGSGVMVSLVRNGAGWDTRAVDLNQIAGERLVPPDFDPESLRSLVDQ